MLLGFPEYAPQSARLAERLGLRHATLEVHRFPDGESRIMLPAALPERVTVCRSLDRPNDKLIELLLAAEAARELGARHLTLVAPYLCYMRQDAAFRPGEAVSQRIDGRFLARSFDAVVTVDPHLHRTARLGDAVPAARACRERGAARASAFVTHAVFAPGTEARLRAAGIAEVWSSDSVPHASNAVPLAPILADGLERLGV